MTNPPWPGPKLRTRLHRFVGPLGTEMAHGVADLMVDAAALREVLTQFLLGELEPDQTIYEIQLLAESAEQQILNPEVPSDADDERKRRMDTDEHEDNPGAA